MISFAPAILEIENLRPLDLLDDLGHDARPLEISPCFDAGAFAMEKHLGKGDHGTRFDIEFLDFDNVAGCHAVLFTASFENCVSHKVLLEKRRGRLPHTHPRDKPNFQFPPRRARRLEIGRAS